MTIEYALGMFLYSAVCFFAGAMIAWFIINEVEKEDKDE